MENYTEYQYEDKPTVCSVHLKFVPCRANDKECCITEFSPHVRIVTRYQSSDLSKKQALDMIQNIPIIEKYEQELPVAEHVRNIDKTQPEARGEEFIRNLEERLIKSPFWLNDD